MLYDQTTASVVAKAKAPTSLDLATGIRAAVAEVLVDNPTIELVSLSTTLATNALVEGKGQPAGLVLIGLDAPDGADPDLTIMLEGGHDPHGQERLPLDLEQLKLVVDALDDRVEAFAVAAEFSVRNPAHELAVEAFLRQHTDKPVTSSHMLSANLNGPKRALTALLNAQLIALIDRLLSTTRSTLDELGVTAPLMVVRGDGSLVSVEFASRRPIETILSGPAASIIGAAHLSGVDDAVVADIGGTTTDIAVLRGGRPQVSDDGAVVGGHATMVEAVAIRTHGLGGDSQVRVAPKAEGPDLVLGPHRVLPISRLDATVFGSVIDSKLSKYRLHDTDALLVLPDGATEAGSLSDVAGTAVTRQAVERSVRQGLDRLAGFTPTDACHVLGLHDDFDVALARKGAALMANQLDRFGQPIATDIETVSQVVFDTLVRRSSEHLLAAMLEDDGLTPDLAQSPLAKRALDTNQAEPSNDAGTTVRFTLDTGLPVVALGAAAATYYPAVAALLGTTAIVPEHAEVANAVGAVVGKVRITHRITIDAPRRGSFTVLGSTEPTTVFDLDEAKALATSLLEQRLADDMAEAGAPHFETEWSWEPQVAEIEDSPYFVRGELIAVGSGRPAATRLPG